MKTKPEIFTRAGKSNVTLKNFLNNLKENDLHYENKQITQCVFLGVLKLKPVPSIFRSNNYSSASASTIDSKHKRIKNNNISKSTSKKSDINKVISGKIRKKNPDKVKASVKKVPPKKPNIIKIKLNMMNKNINNEASKSIPLKETLRILPDSLTKITPERVLTNQTITLNPISTPQKFNPVQNLFDKLKQKIDESHNYSDPASLQSQEDIEKEQPRLPVNLNKPDIKNTLINKKSKKGAKKKSVIYERLAMPLKSSTSNSVEMIDSTCDATENNVTVTVSSDEVVLINDVTVFREHKERTSPRNRRISIMEGSGSKNKHYLKRHKDKILNRSLCDLPITGAVESATKSNVEDNDVVVILDEVNTKSVMSNNGDDITENDVIIVDEVREMRVSPRLKKLDSAQEKSSGKVVSAGKTDANDVIVISDPDSLQKTNRNLFHNSSESKKILNVCTDRLLDKTNELSITINNPQHNETGVASELLRTADSKETYPKNKEPSSINGSLNEVIVISDKQEPPLEKPKQRRSRLLPTPIPSIFLNTRMLLRSELAQNKSTKAVEKIKPKEKHSRLLRSEHTRADKTSQLSSSQDKEVVSKTNVTKSSKLTSPKINQGKKVNCHEILNNEEILFVSEEVKSSSEGDKPSLKLLIRQKKKKDVVTQEEKLSYEVAEQSIDIVKKTDSKKEKLIQDNKNVQENANGHHKETESVRENEKAISCKVQEKILTKQQQTSSTMSKIDQTEERFNNNDVEVIDNGIEPVNKNSHKLLKSYIDQPKTTENNSSSEQAQTNKPSLSPRQLRSVVAQQNLPDEQTDKLKEKKVSPKQKTLGSKISPKMSETKISPMPQKVIPSVQNQQARDQSPKNNVAKCAISPGSGDQKISKQSEDNQFTEPIKTNPSTKTDLPKRNRDLKQKSESPVFVQESISVNENQPDDANNKKPTVKNPLEGDVKESDKPSKPKQSEVHIEDGAVREKINFESDKLSKPKQSEVHTNYGAVRKKTSPKPVSSRKTTIIKSPQKVNLINFDEIIVISDKEIKKQKDSCTRLLRSDIARQVTTTEFPIEPVIEKVVVLIHDEPKPKDEVSALLNSNLQKTIKSEQTSRKKESSEIAVTQIEKSLTHVQETQISHVVPELIKKEENRIPLAVGNLSVKEELDAEGETSSPRVLRSQKMNLQNVKILQKSTNTILTGSTSGGSEQEQVKKSHRPLRSERIIVESNMEDLKLVPEQNNTNEELNGKVTSNEKNSLLEKQSVDNVTRALRSQNPTLEQSQAQSSTSTFITAEPEEMQSTDHQASSRNVENVRKRGRPPKKTADKVDKKLKPNKLELNTTNSAQISQNSDKELSKNVPLNTRKISRKTQIKSNRARVPLKSLVGIYKKVLRIKDKHKALPNKQKSNGKIVIPKPVTMKKSKAVSVKINMKLKTVLKKAILKLPLKQLRTQKNINTQIKMRLQPTTTLKRKKVEKENKLKNCFKMSPFLPNIVKQEKLTGLKITKGSTKVKFKTKVDKKDSKVSTKKVKRKIDKKSENVAETIKKIETDVPSKNVNQKIKRTYKKKVTQKDDTPSESNETTQEKQPDKNVNKKIKRKYKRKVAQKDDTACESNETTQKEQPGKNVSQKIKRTYKKKVTQKDDTVSESNEATQKEQPDKNVSQKIKRTYKKKVTQKDDTASESNEATQKEQSDKNVNEKIKRTYKKKVTQKDDTASESNETTQEKQLDKNVSQKIKRTYKKKVMQKDDTASESNETTQKEQPDKNVSQKIKRTYKKKVTQKDDTASESNETTQERQPDKNVNQKIKGTYEKKVTQKDDTANESNETIKNITNYIDLTSTTKSSQENQHAESNPLKRRREENQIEHGKVKTELQEQVPTEESPQKIKKVLIDNTKVTDKNRMIYNNVTVTKFNASHEKGDITVFDFDETDPEPEPGPLRFKTPKKEHIESDATVEQSTISACQSLNKNESVESSVNNSQNSPRKKSPLKQATITEMFNRVLLKNQMQKSISPAKELPEDTKPSTTVKSVFGEHLNETQIEPKVEKLYSKINNEMPPPGVVKKIEPGLEREEESDICDDEDSRAEWIPEEYAEYMFKYSAKKMMTYKPIFKCKICLLILPTYYKMNKHKEIHTKSQNPYGCKQCSRAFGNVEDLVAHIKIHKGKHPYTCIKCNIGFWSKKAYEAHTPVHVLRKVKQSVKKYRCDVCAKEFSKLCDVERHTRVHTGEKPSVCNICDKGFQQKHNLSKHLLTHLHLKPFHCEICCKQFGRRDVLDRHLLTHSVDKPIKCWMCPKDFIRQSQLNHHVKKDHPDYLVKHMKEA